MTRVDRKAGPGPAQPDTNIALPISGAVLALAALVGIASLTGLFGKPSGLVATVLSVALVTVVVSAGLILMHTSSPTNPALPAETPTYTERERT